MTLAGARWLVLVLVVLATLGTGVAAAPQAPEPEAAASESDFPVATDARVGGDENRTRFVVDLSRPVDLAAFSLADPYRMVIDLPQVVFKLRPKAGESGRGLVKAFRFGLVMPGGSRIVLDATKPFRIEKAFVLDPAEGQPARLVVDLVAIDRAAFLRILAQQNRRPSAADPANKAERNGAGDDPRPVVILDPGHGGIDSGTTAASGVNEKEIVLGFALQLRDRLERTGKYRVEMTRSDDRFVPLGERVRIARSYRASLFISIHADSLSRRDPDVRGATIYTLSETASDAEAARLADAENKADLIAGVDLAAEPNDVADILIDLAQRETKAFSVHFAKTLALELKSAARLHKRPLKAAGFRVLKAPDVPSVLVELGYVTNSDDLKRLMSDTWRKRAADSIVQAVNGFFATRFAGESRVSGAN